MPPNPSHGRAAIRSFKGYENAPVDQCSADIAQVGHRTFSTLGVALVLAIGGLFIIANTIIQMKCSDNSLKKPKNDWDAFSSLHLLFDGPPESTQPSLPLNNLQSGSDAQHAANATRPTTSSVHNTTSSTTRVSPTSTPISSASQPPSLIRASSPNSALVPDDQNSTIVLPLHAGISSDTRLSSDAENNGASLEDEGNQGTSSA